MDQYRTSKYQGIYAKVLEPRKSEYAKREKKYYNQFKTRYGGFNGQN